MRRISITALLALAIATPASAKPWTAVYSNLAGGRADKIGGQPTFGEAAV